MEKEPAWWNEVHGIKLTQGDENDDDDLLNSYTGNASGIRVPKYGWRISLAHKFNCHPTSWSLPPLSQIPSVLGLSLRYLQYYTKLRRNKKRPCMDFFNQITLKQIYGVPLGGIGCGTINRGWKGDFCRWQLKPGVYSYDTPLADQFIVTIRRNGGTALQQVLSTRAPAGVALRAWNWKLCGEHAFYHGLYPRAWSVYDLKSQGVTLTCRQVSPIFPHEYKDTSLPAAVFVWDVENHRDEEIEVTITMSMENGTGNAKEYKEMTASDVANKSFRTDHTIGVEMHNSQYGSMPCTINVAAACKDEVTATVCEFFDPTSDGSEVWSMLLNTGRLRDPAEHKPAAVAGKGKPYACAVAATCHVQSNSRSAQSIDFSLAWDMPKIQFGDGGKAYRRRYARWFGAAGDAGPALVEYALTNYPSWEEKIESWQAPVLNNHDLPAWYKSAIFNELYYVSDGGTVWLEDDGQRETPNGDVVPNGCNNISTSNQSIANTIRRSTVFSEYGKFAYLEGHEYKMYNTYDVHFYASIALACLWPKLELSLQSDIAMSILQANPEKRQYLMDGVWAPGKTSNVVPHDIGCPDDEPWLNVNTYFVHDTADWRDLNPKFVLQVYRDYHITRDVDFLRLVWPVCKIVMNESMKHDLDGDGLIENSGGADQTFDGWCVTGPSAYCGGLWIAALRSMKAAAHQLGEDEDHLLYGQILDKATRAYQDRLWNGNYFNYDCSSNVNHSTSVMADQCAGQWLLHMSGIADVLPAEQVEKALRTVYELNVQKYDGGRHGAVNGMRPHGAVDKSSVQSDEVWTGVTYALAATMVHQGMLAEGFRTASGIYRSAWQRYGMSYQTPEAMRMNKTYRSLAYMRPLSIWGIQYALEQKSSRPAAGERPDNIIATEGDNDVDRDRQA